MAGAIGGVDHCIVLVSDLDAARGAWERLGFRTTPRGVHSAHMGTANHTIMLADDYVELLGVVAETEASAKWVRRLGEAGEGLIAVALRAFDAAAAAGELAARDGQPMAVQQFGRAVAMPGSGAVEARFDVVHLRDEVAPGFRLFFCRHLVPGATCPPGSTDHPNGAVAIESFTIRAEDPGATAAAVARLVGRAVTSREGLPAIETGRAALLFAPVEGRRPGIEAISIRVRDLDVAAAALAAGGMTASRSAAALSPPPDAANGVSLRFVRA